MTNTGAPVLQIDKTRTLLLVTAANQPDRYLHAVWLRDSCRCAECRHPTTNERLLESLTIDPRIQVVDAWFDAEDRAVVLRFSDTHRGVVDYDWLRNHLAGHQQSARPAAGAALWSDGQAFTPRRTAAAELADDLVLLGWLDAMATDGAALLHGVPASDDGLRSIAGLVGEIRATNYGVTWEIEATVDPVSAVDSQRHLLVHTDLPYRDTAPGLQFLLCVVADVAGGASTLVDGYAAAERLRARNRLAWELLTTTEFSYPFVRETEAFMGRAPLIGLRPDGRYFQIRRAPDLVGLPFVPSSSAEEATLVPAIYDAVAQWSSELDDPAHRFTHRLEPGELLAFDNHRMLHGRTAFELGAQGRRNLKGCYLDHEDLNSRRHVLRRTQD